MQDICVAYNILYFITNRCLTLRLEY